MKNRFYLLLALFTLTFSTSVKAAHFTFTVTGSYPNFTFSPLTYNVNVGDTIIWNEDFDTHPLGSTDIPAGAASFGDTTGTHTITTYMYVVTVEGTYNFICTFHGFAGSFVASVATGIQPTVQHATVVSLYPTISHDVLNVNVNNAAASSEKLNLAVYNTLGSNIINFNFQTGNATQLQVGDLANGIYFVAIRENNNVLSVQKFVKN